MWIKYTISISDGKLDDLFRQHKVSNLADLLEKFNIDHTRYEGWYNRQSISVVADDFFDLADWIEDINDVFETKFTKDDMQLEHGD